MQEQEIKYIEQVKAMAKDIPSIQDCDWWRCTGCIYEYYGANKDNCENIRIARALVDKGYNQARKVEMETILDVFEFLKNSDDSKEVALAELLKKYNIEVES